MGLRINNNIEALNAQRSLQKSNSALTKSLQKLSSGYRINVAADDPAGLVISEALRAQLSGLKQAVENSQNAANMIGTVEGSLIEMNDILKSMRQLAVHAANTGTADTNQIAADQAQVDSALRTIDRIANTTKFAGKSLLNGSQAYITSGLVTTELDDVNITRAQRFQGADINVAINVTTSAERASAGAAIADPTSNGTLAVSGNLGTEFVEISAAMTAADLAGAINAVRENTGVYSSGGNVLSEGFGEDAYVKVEVVSGTALGLSSSYNTGVDAAGTVNGAQFTARGLDFSVNTTFFAGEFTLASDFGGGALTAFDVTGGGMKFQLGEQGRPNEQEYMGIESAHSTYLGSGTEGFLNSLRTGGTNDLFQNPEQAITIIDEAISDVSNLRARLGSFQKNTLLTNINSLNVAIENITNSESRIRDANIAMETTDFTKNQILVQTGTAMLAQANVASQSVLQLLG